MDALEGYFRGGLERLGVSVSDDDLGLLRMVDSVYGPALQALMQADLAAVPAEPDLDPSRAPSGR
jgi:hypothetical protein